MDEEFYKSLLESMYDGVYFVNDQSVITYWNKSAERISGFSANQVLGKSCSDNILRHVDELGTELCVEGCPLATTMKDGQTREIEVYLHHKKGHRVPVSIRAAPLKNESGEIIGAVEVFSENNKNIQAMETIQYLRNEIMQDELTKLGNRKYFNLNLENLFHNFKKNNITFGLLFVDVDHFKQVNDTWGHNIGDKVLVMIANTLTNGLRSLDVPCRYGGEEFVIFLPNVDILSLSNVAERLRVLVENSWIEEEGEFISVTASFGGAIVNSEDTMESIVNRADNILYESKENGRNQVRIHR